MKLIINPSPLDHRQLEKKICWPLTTVGQGPKCSIISFNFREFQIQQIHNMMDWMYYQSALNFLGDFEYPVLASTCFRFLPAWFGPGLLDNPVFRASDAGLLNCRCLGSL